MAAAAVDRVGLSWRPALAAGILGHLDRIEVIELMAEDCIGRSARALRNLRRLATTTRVVMHATFLGLASSHAVEARQVEAVARAIGAVEPAAWSEHLAFVRAGGVEIGHLAVPPRTPATVEGSLRNLATVRCIVGSVPDLENGATLLPPPASTMSEAAWTSAVIRGGEAGLLLDLHNLYANAVNFGDDPLALLAAMPLERVRMIHLAGGRRIGAEQRLLDDHLHAVPPPVFDLLAAFARLAPQPVDVIIERDGCFPPFADLLAEIDAARAALARGRLAMAA